MTIIYPAATVVLIRDGQRGLEVLLLKRASALAFGGGAWVFPGGRLDVADFAGNDADLESAARRAAVRETQEEAGLKIVADQLLYFSHWLTPACFNKRFATWFFITEVSGDSDKVMVDDSEIVSYHWYRPGDAVAAFQAGQIDLMRPTRVLLGELARYQTVVESLSHCRQRPQSVPLPELIDSGQGLAVLYPGDQEYSSGIQANHGARNRLWVEGLAWRYELKD